MAVKRTIPGVYSSIQDGNLDTKTKSEAPNVYVLGTAVDGPSNVPVGVTDTVKIAQALFGGDGDLVDGIYLAAAANPQSLVAVRVNGKASSVQGVGGTEHKVQTILEDDTAGSKYKLAYEADTQRLVVVNATNQVVYDNNPGGVSTDLSEVIVRGIYDASQTLSIGHIGTEYVALADLAGSTSWFDVTSTTSVSGATVATLVGTETETSFTPTDVEGGIDPGSVTVTDANGDVWTDSGSDGILVVTSPAVGDATSGFVNYLTGEVKIYWGNGTAPVGDVTLDYDYYAWSAGPSITYVAGADGRNASNLEMFQAYAKAYDILEASDIDVLIPMGANLDTPNIADMTEAQITAKGLNYAAYGATATFPTRDSAQDVLGKVYVEEYLGVKYYFWRFDEYTAVATSDVRAQVFPDPDNIPNLTTAQKTALRTGRYSIAEAVKEGNNSGSGTQFTASSFKEVNYAWEAAYFCYKLEVNDNSATCVVGTEDPASFLPEDIVAWLGEAPTLDLNGDITASGSGLLGNKFMAGTLTHGKGFWATESGYLPVGTAPSESTDVIEDLRGNAVQLGKYLSVCAGPVVANTVQDVFGVGVTVPFAPLYGAAYANLSVEEGMTNKSIAGVRVPFRLTKEQVNRLRDARYVTMLQGRLGTVVVEDVIATTSDSDFQNLTTTRTVTQLIEDIRDQLTPFIGKGLTDVRLAAANTAMNAVLSAYQRAGRVRRFEGVITANDVQRVNGEATAVITVVPAFQLKQITIELSLAVA